MSAPPSFAVNFDYRCPFARNAHEHVMAGLRAGAEWEVAFLPFSLTQVHVGEGDTAVWDDPAHAGDLIALEAGIAVRDWFPSDFLAVHQALFTARHDAGLDLRDRDVVLRALDATGVDADQVLAVVDEGKPRAIIAATHTETVEKHQVFGVPTFFIGDQVAFARIMTRPATDPAASVAVVEHVLRLIVGHPELNELKHTTIPH